MVAFYVASTPPELATWDCATHLDQPRVPTTCRRLALRAAGRLRLVCVLPQVAEHPAASNLVLRQKADGGKSSPANLAQPNAPIQELQDDVRHLRQSSRQRERQQHGHRSSPADRHGKVASPKVSPRRELRCPHFPLRFFAIFPCTFFAHYPLPAPAVTHYRLRS